MMSLRQSLFFFLAIAVTAVAEDLPEPLAILQKECIGCHTEAKRKGGLRIDSRKSLIEGGDTGVAIVPGKATESLLVELLYPDAEMHMPPKGQLNPRQISSIEQWINDGAKWDDDLWARLNLPEKIEVARGTLPDIYHPILAIALSPNGKLLAVGRGSAIDWYRIEPDATGKAETKVEYAGTSPGHADAVQSLDFSPDGKLLVSGGFRSLRFWDPSAPGSPVREINEPFLGRQTAVVFLPDGKKLLVADSVPSQIGRLHEITLSPEKVVSFDTAHRDSIFAIALRADGKQYATSSADKLITIRDSTKHEIVTRLEGHTGYVMAAAFSPEGDRIATGGDDEEIKVWEIKTGKKTGSFASARSGPLYALTWMVDPANGKKKAEEKDAKKAAEINTDLIIAIPESGKPAAFTELKEHEGEQRSTGAKERSFDKVESSLFAFAFDTSSLWAFGGGEDGKLYVWDAKGKLKQTLEPPTPKDETNPVASRSE
jgi:WD40 repeat protein/mono/diheme cytochrome c family protein